MDASARCPATCCSPPASTPRARRDGGGAAGPAALLESRPALEMPRVLLVLLADVLHQLLVRPEPCREADRERSRVVDGIVDRDLAHERAEVLARPALDRVQLLAVRVAPEIEPELVVEADRVDDQRVALVPADRVAVPRGIEIRGVLPAVHEDLPVAVDVPLEQEE